MTFQTRRIREEKRPRAFPWSKKKDKSTNGSTKAKTSGPSGFLKLWKKMTGTVDGKRLTILKRVTVILLSILLAFVLFTGVVRALVSLKVISLTSFLNTAGSALPADKDGFTNVLLLGKGDDDHDGIDLTDTIMVASVDPEHTKSAILLSLPRDLYMLSTEKMGKGRINELYRNYKSSLRSDGMSAAEASRESMKELMAELGRKLGIEIHHAVMANFSGFEQAVDAIGGVDIDVPYDIVDREYPGPDYTYQTFEIKAGPAHLDGATALKYARSRHTTSDFGRSARQQQIIQALGGKAQEKGIIRSPGKLLSLYNILSKNVETTMTTSELLGAAKMAQRLDRTKVISLQLSDRNGLYSSLAEPGGFLYSPPRDQFGGASVLLPVSIPEFPVTWKQVSAFVNLLIHNRTVFLNPSRIMILNASGKRGLAATLANELIRFDFSVADTANASIEKQNATFIVGQTPQDGEAANWFSKLLKLPLAKDAKGLTPEEQGQVTIVIGKDYKFTPLQDLLPATP
ncbi:MAG: LCP family protein [Candidatus Peribacteraceae bacterium]